MNKTVIIGLLALVFFAGWGLGRGHERNEHVRDYRQTASFDRFQGCVDAVVAGKYEQLPDDHDRPERNKLVP